MPVSALVTKLITDIQAGIQAAFLQQVETTSREIEMLRALPEERLAEYLVLANSSPLVAFPLLTPNAHTHY